MNSALGNSVSSSRLISPFPPPQERERERERETDRERERENTHTVRLLVFCRVTPLCCVGREINLAAQHKSAEASEEHVKGTEV